MQFVCGNKTYSSWSLRPWLLLKHLHIEFKELNLSFNDSDFKAKAKALSPTGKVPLLIDGDVKVWDSLSIVEYVAEKFPGRVWPTDVKERAIARSVCAEMHSSFSDLRTSMPMHAYAHFPGCGWNVNVQKDIDRICEIWIALRAEHGARGPYLFGTFSAADAFFAPVVLRFRTYEPKGLPKVVEEYCQTILALPELKEWCDAARLETDFVARNELYQANPKSAK